MIEERFTTALLLCTLDSFRGGQREAIRKKKKGTESKGACFGWPVDRQRREGSSR